MLQLITNKRNDGDAKSVSGEGEIKLSGSMTRQVRLVLWFFAHTLFLLSSHNTSPSVHLNGFTITSFLFLIFIPHIIQLDRSSKTCH